MSAPSTRSAVTRRTGIARQAEAPPPALSTEALVVRIRQVSDRHGVHSSDFRSALVLALKEAVRQGRAQVEAMLMQDGSGTRCAERLSLGQDNLVQALYDLASRHVYPALNPSTGERLSIVAVGGYGRGTLAPGSDIDLLFLMPYKQTAWGESVVEFILYVLWDTGFKVGHSTRSVDDCIRLARSDGTIMTAILEARYICGDLDLCAELHRRFRKKIVARQAKAFIAAKLAERDARHLRAGQSRYLVEPDVKDGKGGLRDLHTLFWIARFLHDVERPADLVATGLFTREEFNRFMRSEDFLWAVRCHLHFIAGRDDDRLGFDKQAEIAERLGYKSHGGLKHVERFMKHYFLVAKDVGDLTRIFCAVLEAQEMKKVPRLSELFSGLARRTRRKGNQAPRFRLDAGRLNVLNPREFIDDPVSIIRLFGQAEDRNRAIHPDVLRLVRRSLNLIGPAMRDDSEANVIFLNLLTASRDPEAILRRMNEAGVLGRFIPDFGRIVALMQFNMYHHYTVDEHLLRTVGVLHEIETGAFRDEHPLASDLVKTLTPSSKRALYLAAFLHDVAKGRKEDHSIAGEAVAKSLGPRLGLSAAETEMAAWLVRHHLLMSETAQMRDLNDFKTILDFTAVVQSLERLKLLLILTVCDIRAVGPGVWNGWKGQLLRTLYFEAEPVLTGGHSSISRRDRVADALSAFAARMTAWHEAKLKAWFARHYDPYWLNVDIDHQVAHAELIAGAEAANRGLASAARTDAFTGITELTIFTPDHPRLLAQLTGACAAGGADIAGAQIFTTADGMALDTLLIQREFDSDADELRRAERVTFLIRQVLAGEVRSDELLSKLARTKGRIRAFRIEPRVNVDNELSNLYTVIEVNGLDRVGLLYELTEALFRLNLNIASAHVTTFGERAIDVFYVTDLTGAKIANSTRRNNIVRHLMGVLEPKDGDLDAA